MPKSLQRVLLAVFVIVDLALIVGAVRHVNGTPPSSDLPEASATVAPSATTGSPTASATAPAQLDYSFQASKAVALSSANDGTIVFGTRGRCAAGDDAEVSVSTNAGADFSPSTTGLTTTLAVKTTGAGAISVVGTDADCDPQQVSSTDGGKTWTDDDEITLWYPDPERTREVVSPAGKTAVGAKCIVTSVSQVTAESARVSCANGTFRGTGNSGEKWVSLGRLDNVRVGTFLTPSKGYALARYNGCGANQFSTTDGGVTWQPGGCITGDPAQAIAATVNGLTAVVSGDPYVSADDGKTWKQP